MPPGWRLTPPNARRPRTRARGPSCGGAGSYAAWAPARPGSLGAAGPAGRRPLGLAVASGAGLERRVRLGDRLRSGRDLGLRAFRATAALRSAFVYSRQCGLHIRPRPSFWLGWTGKSSARRLVGLDLLDSHSRLPGGRAEYPAGH